MITDLQAVIKVWERLATSAAFASGRANSIQGLSFHRACLSKLPSVARDLSWFWSHVHTHMHTIRSYEYACMINHSKHDYWVWHLMQIRLHAMHIVHSLNEKVRVSLLE